MERKVILIGSFFGLTAIVLGAFGAHALKKVLTIEELTSFETGVKYQMYHALFLIFLGINNLITNKAKKTIATLVFFGVLFFSVSIYLLSTSSVSGINFKPIGFVTPIGGLLLIVAWALLMLNLLKKKA
jgi:uncharacterized membrane protein YgdD (TMEM256/DUF423 family)